MGPLEAVQGADIHLRHKIIHRQHLNLSLNRPPKITHHQHLNLSLNRPPKITHHLLRITVVAGLEETIAS